jgi:MarR family transcriptional regulator, 2-MHQ and catechol-resistance regulon repressor
MAEPAAAVRDDLSAVHLWLVLWKAHDAVRSHAERSIQQLGMCLTDFGILELLLHKGPLPVNTVGGKLGLTSGSATTAIDRLAERGLVARRVDPSDRRARIVALTRAGRGCIAPAFAQHANAMERAASVLSAQERAWLITLLKRLGRHAQHRLAEDERGPRGTQRPPQLETTKDINRKNTNRDRS